MLAAKAGAKRVIELSSQASGVETIAVGVGEQCHKAAHRRRGAVRRSTNGSAIAG